MRWIILVSIFFTFASHAVAAYMTPKLEEIPLDRLIKNIESEIEAFDKKALASTKKPPPGGDEDWQKSDLIHSLARLHAMAYAFQFDKLKIATYGPGLQPYPVYKDYFKSNASKSREPLRRFPENLTIPSEPGKAAVAQAHLEKAISLYRMVSNKPRTAAVATLGLGWCLEQAGKNEEAKSEYRKLISNSVEAFKSSKEKDTAAFGSVHMDLTTDSWFFKVYDEATKKEKLLFSAPILELLLKTQRASSRKHLRDKLPKEKLESVERIFDKISLELAKPHKGTASVVASFGREIEREYAGATVESSKNLLANNYIVKNLENLGRLAQEISSSTRNEKKIVGSVSIQLLIGPLSIEVQDAHLYTEASSYAREFRLYTPVRIPGKRKRKLKFALENTKYSAVSKVKGQVEFPKSVAEIGKRPKDYKLAKNIGKHIEAEAATYLIPLLNPVKDKAEINEIHQFIFLKAKDDESRLHAISPIALPIKGGLTRSDLIGRGLSVPFDLGGYGLRNWEWITPNAAWLIWLPQSGNMTGRNLFGEATFGSFWSHGYQALCSLDDNGDDQISGKELHNLALWNDANSDGKLQARELLTLESQKIRALSCLATWNDEKNEYWSPKGALLNNGETLPTYDFVLKETPTK